jgi:hypothetical protein
MRRRFRFTFPPELITEPAILSLGTEFEVVTSVVRTDISKERGSIVVDLEGSEKSIERSLAWAASKGVRVILIGGDIARS